MPLGCNFCNNYYSYKTGPFVQLLLFWFVLVSTSVMYMYIVFGDIVIIIIFSFFLIGANPSLEDSMGRTPANYCTNESVKHLLDQYSIKVRERERERGRERERERERERDIYIYIYKHYILSFLV